MAWAQVNPAIVRVVEPPTPETTVADVLLGAVSLVGFLLVAAFVVGIAAGVLFILFKRVRARLTGEDESPPVSASPLTR
jgi:hypothetical protein